MSAMTRIKMFSLNPNSAGVKASSQVCPRPYGPLLGPPFTLAIYAAITTGDCAAIGIASTLHAARSPQKPPLKSPQKPPV